MLLTTLFATATIGAVSGTVCFLITKEDQRKMKNSISAYLNDPYLHYSYSNKDKSYTITPTTMETITKVKISETESVIECVLYIQILQDLTPVYRFKYNKNSQEISDVREEYFFGPNKGKATHELLEQFNLFILTSEWKSKIDHQQEVANENSQKQKETDPDIDYHLREINKKIEWLQNTQSLEIEEAHKVDVLKEDMEQVLNAYHSFRNETKIAFKEKVLEAFNQINAKLNELSIKKEERIISEIDKTISLIKKR